MNLVKHKEIFLVVCIVSSSEVWCITMPVYRFNLIWSPATRLVNRDRSDKGGSCRYAPCFQVY